MTIALLAAALVSLCHAQPKPVTTENHARYYVYGAFLTHAVPEIMGARVTLGPELEQRLGVASGADRKRIYEALMSYIDKRPLTVRKATTDELATYRRALKQPVFHVQAGEVALLVEYDMQANAIPFVGQLAAPPMVERRAAPAQVRVAVPKPEPAKAAPPAPPPPVAAPPALPPPVAEPLKPNGPCVVKPVMSEQDLANCRGGVSTRTATIASPPPAPAKPQARVAPPPPAPRAGPCVIKPVMSEEDLANCRATSTVAPRLDPGPPAVTRAPAPSARPAPRKPAAPCVIKPVMSDEDRIACGIR